jgi:hypothetical protein
MGEKMLGVFLSKAMFRECECGRSRRDGEDGGDAADLQVKQGQQSGTERAQTGEYRSIILLCSSSLELEGRGCQLAAQLHAERKTSKDEPGGHAST